MNSDAINLPNRLGYRVATRLLGYHGFLGYTANILCLIPGLQILSMLIALWAYPVILWRNSVDLGIAYMLMQLSMLHHIKPLSRALIPDMIIKMITQQVKHRHIPMWALMCIFFSL